MRARTRRRGPGRAALCMALATLATLAVPAVLGGAGCTEKLVRVAPWERGELASDLMRPDLNPMEDRDWEHVYFSKEATPGDPANGGGGCGCN